MGFWNPTSCSICESEKKREKKKKEENWTLSLNIKQGMIVSNQEAFKEGENEVVSWTS